MVPVSWYIGLGAILFMIGVSGVVLRKNIIIMLMGIELMLNSVNINLVAFSYYLNDIRGQIFAVFIITIAAAEVAVALGILISLVRNRGVFDIDKIDTMKG